MEYIHFVDSDDWLELNCIEECVKVALKNQAQIVWHGCKHFYEDESRIGESDFPKKLGLDKNKNYSGLDIFTHLPYPAFSWVWQGLILFQIANKVKFEENIESEDALFGMQVFALCNKIYTINHGIMFYRIRPNSTSQHTLANKNHKIKSNITFPPHQQDLVEAFNGDIYDIRYYRFAYSCAIICLRMDEFLKKENLSKELKEILKTMIEVRAIYAFGGCGFNKDPRNIRGICSKLLDYTPKVRFGSKLAYHFPSIYKILKMIKKCLGKSHS